MAISLYDATVRTYEQILGSTAGVLEKGAAFCREKGIDPSDFVKARLYDDMAPLHFQVVCVAHHSRGALEAMTTGVFSPPDRGKTYDYAGLQTLVTETQAWLKSVSAEAVNGAADRDITFKVGETVLPFRAEDFMLTFSLPNFYFHATTAYDILRAKGVSIGKRDFMGRMRIKRA